MRPSAILINVSRGPVVKIDDLVNALRTRRIAGAGLDVFEFEPDVPAALMEMENVVLSPHMGGCTVEARHSAYHACIDNIARVFKGLSPATPVFQMGGSA
jgi:phosphoglycerate dehydrogenase-like enzyme